jgi:hypothetical protein
MESNGCIDIWKISEPVDWDRGYCVAALALQLSSKTLMGQK